MLMYLKAMTTAKKRNYKKTLFIIPYLFTYLNAIFGFLCILKALDGDYYTAAYYIILAACMDSIDGRLARALGSASYFGMELDSLCDAISFCLAPGVLLYCWFPEDLGMFARLSLILYLCAGLYRLARFNVTQEKQQTYFIGLPTPIAAFFIASLILSHTWISTHIIKILLHKTFLFPIIAGIAFLMVSPIPFYSFKRYKLKLPFDYIKLLLGFALVTWMVLYGYPLLFFAIVAYILSGIVSFVCKKLLIIFSAK